MPRKLNQLADGTYEDIGALSYTAQDFEGIFLSDKERTLHVAFNPKVTSLKNTIQETKQDTLGGKYPYFFRNGNLKYKEFPISGLISYQMDEEATFMSKSELGLSVDTS
jgi:hypothetical protein